MVSVKQNSTKNPNDFSWREGAHGYFLLYQGRIVGKVSRNNSKSYVAEVDGQSFYFPKLSLAKQKALQLARTTTAKESVKSKIATDREMLDVVNRLGSKSVIAKHGKAVKVDPVAFRSDYWKITFSDGYTMESKIPKMANGSGGLSQHIDAAFDAAASGDRGGLTTTKAAIRKALNSAKQPEGQKAREYIFGVLDIIVKNRSKWSGAQMQKAVREYSSAVYGKVLPKLKIQNPIMRNQLHYVVTNRMGAFGGSTAVQLASKIFKNKTLAEKELKRLQNVNVDERRYYWLGSQDNSKHGLHEIQLLKGKGIQNETATDFHAFKENRSKEHFKMFQGKQSSGAMSVLQPDSAPKETSRLGDLVLMKVIKSNGSKQNINFDGEAFLAIDLRKNLWAIGKDARINNVTLPRKGELKYLGKLKQIDYVTAKKHIGGNKLTRFWHELGEVDKNYPSLYVDADGFPIIHGGGYDVWNIGIVN